MQLHSILKLKYPNANFLKDIILQDDGYGAYIKEWNMSDPPPTDEMLDEWRLEFGLKYRQQQARLMRKYPSWQEQMDMQYHDKINNTTIWEDTIELIKQSNPIPTE